SVGDAYFSKKSFDRIRELCEREGTTLLLVSHDVYSASRICERMIWLDRGRILMDADSPSVIKAYEDSVREQEERRLRRKKQNQLQEFKGVGARAQHLLVEICSNHNMALPCPVIFSAIELSANGEFVSALPFGPDAFDAALPAHLQSEAAC